LAKLKPALVAALKPYLKQQAPARQNHEEIPSTYVKAAFFEPGEILASNHAPDPDSIEYSFAERRALYLRLTPVIARTQSLKDADLYDLARNRQIDPLVRQQYMGLADRNQFGAIVYEYSGTSTTPRASVRPSPMASYGLSAPSNSQTGKVIPTFQRAMSRPSPAGFYRTSWSFHRMSSGTAGR
jgi:hypothetical protein